jgi:hypothetical protein
MTRPQPTPEVLGTDLLDEAGGLRRLRPKCGDLALDQVRIEVELEGQLRRRTTEREPRDEVHPEAVVQPLPAVGVLRGRRRVQQVHVGSRERPGGRRPARDHLVVLVPGQAVRTECEDGVRSHLADGGDQPLDRREARSRGAAPVLDAEEPVLLHPEDRERRLELALPHSREPAGWPCDGIVGPVLASRRRDADHALAGVSGRSHDAARQEHLVVGVGPDAEDGPEVTHGTTLGESERTHGRIS